MARDHISDIEISSIVFLVVFTLLIIPSIFLWVKYMRAGFPWRYGFWGAFLICASRIACFVSELVFYGSGYTNIDAAIAYAVTLAIGYVGLLECLSALYTSWAEAYIDFSPKQQDFHGKIRLLSIAAMVLLIYGGTHYGANGSISSTGAACIQAGTILLLVLTVIQSAYIAYGWVAFEGFSTTLVTLSVVVAALYCRIIFGVFTSFHRGYSMLTFDDNNVKYLVGATLIPEVVALVLMIALGFVNIKTMGTPKYNDGHPQAYNVSDIEARREGQVIGHHG